MILIINICKEKFHYYEFVKPIEDILEDSSVDFFTEHYQKMKQSDLAKASKVIICGTSLKDNEFTEKDNLKYFNWLKDFDKPVLGICAGMQIIGLLNGGKAKKKTEVGFFKEEFNKEFLGLKGEQEVWHLHNYFVDFSKLSGFDVFCAGNGISQAVKHKEKNIYGVLFHPEVRNKKLILEFVK